MAAIPAITSEMATNRGCSENELESSTGEMAGWKGPRVPEDPREPEELWVSTFLEPDPDPLLVPAEEPLDPDDADPLLVPEEPLDPDDADPLLVPEPEELREPELLRRPDALDPLLVPDELPELEPRTVPVEPEPVEPEPVEPVPVEPVPVDPPDVLEGPPVVVALEHFLGLMMTESHSPSTSPLSSASAHKPVSAHQPQKGSLVHVGHVWYPAH